MSEILLINDFVSRGKIAGNMIEPVLSYHGHQTYFLPSAIISHNFSLGNVVSYDTFAYMADTMSTWNDLGFSFDVIFIGFIENTSQKDLIINYIKNLPYHPLVILDPILGDDGKVYPSLGKDKIEIYKEVLDLSDIVIPNYTEAILLGLDDFSSLRSQDKKYLITSVIEDSNPLVLGISDHIHKVSYEQLNLKYAGTGDLFDAIFLSYYLENKDFDKAIESSVSDMSKILTYQKKINPKSDFIFIERILASIYGGNNAR